MVRFMDGWMDRWNDGWTNYHLIWGFTAHLIWDFTAFKNIRHFWADQEMGEMRMKHFNPIALRKAKIAYNFGLSECKRVKSINIQKKNIGANIGLSASAAQKPFTFSTKTSSEPTIATT